MLNETVGSVVGEMDPYLCCFRTGVLQPGSQAPGLSLSLMMIFFFFLKSSNSSKLDFFSHETDYCLWLVAFIRIGYYFIDRISLIDTVFSGFESLSLFWLSTFTILLYRAKTLSIAPIIPHFSTTLSNIFLKPSLASILVVILCRMESNH